MTTAPDATWARALAVFDEAIAITDRQARDQMVAAACAGDASLGDAVRRLLEADAADSPVLDTPAAEHAADLVDDDHADARPSPTGRVVGPYRIIRELGRGGMGVVYLAERDDVPMRVALKLVRGGLAAPDHLERFLFERRVLARLEHRYIARLLDAGVEPDGTPWFAMEYVEGEPIDEFCDARHLSVDDRLALFERVCEGVRFAHGSLVVHRDLKPSNILVVDSPRGTAEPAEPKLLDFGIAKLLDGGDPAMTGTATRLLTPEYAAPEQVLGHDVTTATDVYSLGVVLYELLAGRRPYTLRDASLADVARAVLETVPPRLSSVVTSERLRRQLTGDLDTIVGKALEKETARRYPSADALLDDIRRHREGRTVSARPATLGYRARTFVRRYRTLVASVVVVVTLLAGFAASMTYQQALTERALLRAESETAKARDVTRFLVDMFREADPLQQTGASRVRAGARGTVDLGTERIERELARQPEIRVELLQALAVIHRNQGNVAQSRQLLERAIGERRRMLGSGDKPDLELASLYHELGNTLRNSSSYASADSVLRQALTMRRALLPPNHPDIAVTLSELGVLRQYQGQYDNAQQLLEQAIAIQNTHTESIELATSLDRLAAVRNNAGDWKSAEAYVRRSIAIRERVVGADHPLVASALLRLASVMRDIDVTVAERAARQALAIQLQQLGPGHPSTLTTQSELSLVLMKKGDLAAAERLQREVLAGRQRLYGDYHRDVGGSLGNLSNIVRQRGDLDQSDSLLRRGIEVYGKATGSASDVGPMMAELAFQRLDRGDVREAVSLARQLTHLGDKTTWLWNAEMGDQLGKLASLLATNGECDAARTLAERSAAIHDNVSDRASAVPRPTNTLAACGIVR